MSEHVQNGRVKGYFLTESLRRAQFLEDIKTILRIRSDYDPKQDVTICGTLHRVWGDIRDFGNSITGVDVRLIAAYDHIGGPKMVHAVCWSCAEKVRRCGEAASAGVASTRIVKRMDDRGNKNLVAGMANPGRRPYSILRCLPLGRAWMV